MSIRVKFSDVFNLLGCLEFTSKQVSLIAEILRNAGADPGLLERYLKVEKPFTTDESRKILSDVVHGKVFVGGVLTHVTDVMLTTSRGAVESLEGRLKTAKNLQCGFSNAAELYRQVRDRESTLSMLGPNENAAAISEKTEVLIGSGPVVAGVVSNSTDNDDPDGEEILNEDTAADDAEPEDAEK